MCASGYAGYVLLRCALHWSRGHVLVQQPFRPKFREVLCPLSATPIIPSLHYCSIIPLCAPFSLIVHISYEIVIHHTPAMCSSPQIPSFAVIPKSALFAAVPLRHFLTICGLPVLLPFCC